MATKSKQMSKIISDFKVADTPDQPTNTINSNIPADVIVEGKVNDGTRTNTPTTTNYLNTPAKSHRTIMDVKSEIEAKRKVHQEIKAKAQER
jgi:hypothetical protein